MLVAEMTKKAGTKNPLARILDLVEEALAALVRQEVAQDEAGREGGEHGVEVECRGEGEQGHEQQHRDAEGRLRARLGVVGDPLPQARAPGAGTLGLEGHEDAHGGEEREHGHVRRHRARGREHERHRHDGKELAHGAVGLDDAAHRGARKLTVAHDGDEGAVGGGGERDGEGGDACGGKAEVKRERGDDGERHADGPADGAVPARATHELAEVEVIAGDKEEDSHAEATHERHASGSVDDAHAVRTQDGAGDHEEDDLRNRAAGNEARQKRRRHDSGEDHGEHDEVLGHGTVLPGERGEAASNAGIAARRGRAGAGSPILTQMWARESARGERFCRDPRTASVTPRPRRPPS